MLVPQAVLFCVVNVAHAQGDVVSPFDALRIQAKNAAVHAPIDGPYLVEATGHLLLGLPYGRVDLRGITVNQVEQAIEKHLTSFLFDPDVDVTYLGPVKRWTAPVGAGPRYRIQPGNLLAVQVLGMSSDRPLKSVVRVQEDGQIMLGPRYGSVEVANLTLEQAEKEVEHRLSNVFASLDVAITHAGWHLLSPEEELLLRLDQLEKDVQELEAAISDLQQAKTRRRSSDREHLGRSASSGG